MSRDGVSPDRCPTLSVILVSWNLREMVLDCLRSLHAEPLPFAMEVVLVDNGSQDGTVDAVRELFPHVLVVANPANVGFARANNQGVALSRGRYVLYLNTDTIVGPGTLAACVAELERDGAVGAVGCRLMYPDGRVQYEGGRNPYLLRHLFAELLYLNMLFPRSRIFGDQLLGYWDHRDTRDVEALMGAFMMVRREVVDAVGGLPEELIAYHEDLSFCLRIRRLGHRIRYLGDVETVHLTNQGTRRNALRWYMLEGEYRVLLIREAQGDIAAAVGRAVFGLRSLIRLLVALLAAPLPGLARVRAKYPRVFEMERHALHVAWSISPRLVRPLVPVPARAPLPTTTLAPITR
jgi:GT2 family glycosyltransferase